MAEPLESKSSFINIAGKTTYGGAELREDGDKKVMEGLLGKIQAGAKR